MPVQGLHVYQTFVIFGGGGGGDENSDDLVSVIFLKQRLFVPILFLQNANKNGDLVMRVWLFTTKIMFTQKYMRGARGIHNQ